MDKETVLLFGAGDMARRAMLRLIPKGIDPVAIMVSDINKNPKSFFGKPVLAISTAKKMYPYSKVYIGVGETIRNVIKSKLELEEFSTLIPFFSDKVTYSSLPVELKMKYLYEWYKDVTGEVIDWNNLQTFNEKIQWIKLFDRPEEKGQLADKYAVREYVSDMIGEEYLVPLIGVWKSFSEIDFDILPNEFVLKCNHGSGWNSIITDKSSLNVKSEKIKFDKWMNTCFTDVFGVEQQYEYIKPRIIAEELLKNRDESDIEDYKVFVFHGKAKMIQVDIGRWHEHRRNLYTVDWELMDSSIQFEYASNLDIKPPKSLDRILRAAEKLAGDYIHVRVDFYVIDEKPYFGEMTFTHGSGQELFVPKQFGKVVGDWLKLPDDYNSNKYYGKYNNEGTVI